MIKIGSQTPRVSVARESSTGYPAEQEVEWKKMPSPQFKFVHTKRTNFVATNVFVSKIETPQLPQSLRSFTRLPETLKRPEIVKAVIEYEGAVSTIVATTAQLSSHEEPYELPLRSDVPTDEELVAEGEYKRAYNKRQGEYRQRNNVFKRIASLGDGSQARQKFAEEVGPEAYADYREWKMAEMLAALLSWSLSEEDTKAAAEKIASLWANGLEVDAIMEAVPVASIEGDYTRDLLVSRLSQR